MGIVRIIAFDLDGTAIVSNRELPLKNKNALEEASSRGIYIVPCTGRLLSFLPESVANLKNLRYVITCNGATVEDISNKSRIYSAYLKPEKTAEVFDALEKFDIYKEIYSFGQAYTVKGYPEKAGTYFQFPASKMHFTTKNYVFVDNLKDYFTENGLQAEKINLPYIPLDIRQKLKDKLSRIEGLKLTSSIPDNLEINDSSATKGKALEALCKHLGINASDAMALGDNGNDVPMLLYAGHSYAMGNSSQEAFDAARFRTGNCDDCGLADAIFKELG